MKNIKSYVEESAEKFANLQKKVNEGKDIIILAIESSCDETSISIVKNGREILSNIVATQIPIHKRFGGVVPEVASRNHILAIDKVFAEALEKSGCQLENLDAIAVTYGAGLVGALLVGVNFAKALAYSLQIPLIAVSHVKGHIAANYLSHANLKPPFLCLMVSGGHTAILNIQSYNQHQLIGTTVDDAAGEAFDKVARVLGLPYPGGVEIDKLAQNGLGNITFVKHNSLKDSYNFSFSGIKTAIINYVHNLQQKAQNEKNKNKNNIELTNFENENYLSSSQKADICASFQNFVVEELSLKAVKACKNFGINSLVLAGGVGANSQLRLNLEKIQKEYNLKVYFPVLSLCTDNAAMIASAAYFQLYDGVGLADLSLTAKPTIGL